MSGMNHTVKLENRSSPVGRVIQKNDGNQKPSSNGQAASSFAGKIRTDKSSDQVDNISSPRRLVDIAEFSHGPSRHSDELVAPITLLQVIADSTPQKWESLIASERVEFHQRWLMHAKVTLQMPGQLLTHSQQSGYEGQPINFTVSHCCWPPSCCRKIRVELCHPRDGWRSARRCCTVQWRVLHVQARNIRAHLQK